MVLLPLHRQQAFSHPGDAFLASPVLCFKITAVTFRRRFNSYDYLVYSLGLMRPLCYGIGSHPYSPFLRAVFLTASYYPSRGFPAVLVIPKLLPQPLVDSASVLPWERCMRTCKLLEQR